MADYWPKTVSVVMSLVADALFATARNGMEWKNPNDDKILGHLQNTLCYEKKTNCYCIL